MHSLQWPSRDASCWRSLGRPPKAAQSFQELMCVLWLPEHAGQQIWTHSFELLSLFSGQTTVFSCKCSRVKLDTQAPRSGACISCWLNLNIWQRADLKTPWKLSQRHIPPRAKRKTQMIHFELINNCHISVRATEEPVWGLGTLSSL